MEVPKGLSAPPLAPKVPEVEDDFLPDQVMPQSSMGREPAEELELPDSFSRLGDLYRSASAQDPTRAAEVQEYSKRLNEPESYVDRNLENVKKTASAPGVSFFKELEDEYPGTTSFLSQPNNMAVAHDDLDNLREHEGIFQKIKGFWEDEKSAYESGGLQEELQFIRYNQLQGKTDALGSDYFRLGDQIAADSGITATDPEQRATQLEARIAKLEERRPKGFGVRQGLFGAAEFAPQILGGLGYGVKYAAPIAGVTAAATGITGPGVVPAVLGAATAGMVAGEVDYNYRTMAGQSYGDLLKIKDVTGAPLDPEVVRVASMSIGAAAAGLSLFKLDALLKTVPGGKAFLEKFTSTVPAKVLGNQATYTQALKNFTSNYVKTVAQGSAAMTAITGINIAGQEAAKALSDGDFESPSVSEVASELGNTTISASFTMGALGLPGLTLGGVKDIRAARRTQATQEFIGALKEKVEKSKLKERAPDIYRAHVEALVGDSPVQDLHVPQEALINYLQTKGIDPDVAAAELGITKEFEESKLTGGDVRIPLAKWAEKIVGTEHEAGLRADIKLDPNDMTARQLEQRKAEIKQKVIDAENEAKAKNPDAPPQSPIADKIEESLIAAGRTKKEAKYGGVLYDSFFRSLAEKSGETPQALFDRYKVEIESGTFNPDAEALNQSERSKKLKREYVDVRNEIQKEFPLDESEVIPATTVSKELADRSVTPEGKRELKSEAITYISERGEKEFINDQTGWKVVIPKDDKLLGKVFGSIAHESQSLAILNLESLVKNAKYIWELPSRKGAERNDKFKYLYAPLNVGDKQYLVKINVAQSEKSKGKADYYAVRTIEVEGRDGVSTSGEPAKAVNSSLSTEPSGLTVAQTLDAINKRRMAGDTYFQDKSEPSPAFYSKLTRTVEEKMGNSASVQQVNGMLKDIKPEERKWSGLDEFLAGKEKVSKAELLEFLQENQVELKEVVKTEDSAPKSEGFDLFRNGRLEAVFSSREEADRDLAYRNESRPNDQWEVRERSFTANTADAPKFSQYVLPGGENYREKLYTLPTKETKQNDVEIERLQKIKQEGDQRLKASSEKISELRKALQASKQFSENASGITTQVYWSSDVRRTGERTPEQLAGLEELRASMPTKKLKQLLDEAAEAYRFMTVQTREAFKAGERLGELQRGEDGQSYKSSHWEEGNVLAHTRLNDRVDADGNKVLHIEEIQSDWHQDGRKKGYKGDGNLGVKDLPPEVKILPYEDGKFITSDVTGFKDLNSIASTADESAALFIGKRDNRVPDAPFKKTWHELAFKKILREAAEKGYDKVTWTTGEQQAERYDISKQVDEIVMQRMVTGGKENGNVYVRALKDGEEVSGSGIMPEAKVPEVLGKEVYEKLKSQADAGTNVAAKLEGEGLKIGGDGMKGFYDKILVDFANKFGKKFGAKVENANLPSGFFDSKFTYDGPRLSVEEIREISKTVDSKTEQSLNNAAYALSDSTTIRTYEGQDLYQLVMNGLSISAAEALGGKMIEEKGGLKVHSLTITPEMKASVLGEGFSLFQNAKDPYGSYDPRERIIKLFKKADKSTFLHESGHFFLDVLTDVASRGDAPSYISQDFDTILKWFGVESANQISTKQHEQFARGFEAYLREGKAPSSALEKAFFHFGKWLTKIYKDARRLNVELSPEIREVMDRMLATDEEIEAAQKSIGYEVPTLEGISDAMAEKLSDFQDRARAHAEATLLRDQMKETTKLHKEFLENERAKIAKTVTEELNQEPLYAGSIELEKRLENASGKKRSSDKLATRFLEGKLKDEESATIEEIAELNGFASGEDFSRKILEATEGDSFAREVSSRVEAGMAQYTDMMNTGAIKAEALKAIHNDRMIELLSLEREAFQSLVKNAEIREEASKRNRQEAREISKSVKEQAAEIINAKPVKEATRFQVYVTAERNAAKSAATALAKKDYESAVKFKDQQLINHALAAESLRAGKEAEKSYKYLEDFNKRGRDLLDMPFGFVKQIDALMSRLKLGDERPVDAKTMSEVARQMMNEGEDASEIANRTGLVQDQNLNWVPEKLPEFVARVRDNYYNLSIPDALLDGSKKSHKDFTVGELRDFVSAVQGISSAGKKFNRFLGEFNKVEVKQAANQFAMNVQKEIGAPYGDLSKIGSKYSSELKEKISKLLELPDIIVPDLVNILTLTQFLDGGKNDGPAKDFIYRPMKIAEEGKITRYEKMTKVVNDLMLKHFEPKELTSYKDKRTEEKILGRFLTREEVLSLALNWGNEGNRDRIRQGFGLDDGQVERILGTLEKKEWDFVQDVWDHIDTYWPEVVKLELEVNGVEPRKVSATEVTTRHGKYAGGYYPIAYDFNKSSDASRNAEQKNALYKQFGTAHAQTDRGHTEARASSVKRPVRLSLDVMFNHLENVVHDLEYRRAVIDVNRFLAQREVKGALEAALGTRGTKSISDWLISVASDQGEHLSMADKAFRWFRFNATFSTLSFRLFTLPMDVSGNVLNSIWEVGPKKMLGSMKEFAKSPTETKAFVESKSERMRFRSTQRDRDILEMSKKWSGKDSNLAQFGFWSQSFADELVSYPLWAEVYRNEVSKVGEEKAKHVADETVARTLGSGSMLDQVGAQRGPESKKILSMYFSFLSMMFNRAWLSGKMAGLEYNQGNTGKAIAIMAKTAVYGWGLQALNENFWRELFRNAKNTDEDERTKRVLARTLTQPFSYVWLVRDVAGYGVERALGEKNRSYKFSPLESAIESILKPVADGIAIAATDKKLDQPYAEDAARGASVILGYPQQVNSLTFNFIDWLQNNGELTWRDALTRKTKK